MVVLNKIYTKKGDDGKTELGDGKRIVKFSTRVEAYGTVDELNAMIGTITSMNIETKLDSCLERIQNDLFDLGADLCLPVDTTGHMNPEPLRVEKSLTERLESEIDNMNKRIDPIRSFVLPGGNEIAAKLHLCRTICRRAERLVVKLIENEQVNKEALKYLNRLSDWFFVAARVSNDDGKKDILWKPAMNRKP
ncbi:MAG: cob(I)yrinic acid a,c-diamide adenosyltransferase [Pseudomonadota bacterium]|nr:cob(I)yrinic acid a,c-diamide adenosyltransferase [Pseudomonadota bacterium]